MMAVWCEGCRSQVLLWPGDLRGVANTARGAVVSYRCGAGHDGVEFVPRLVGARA